MGLTMEGRGHTLRHVGNSVISIHQEAHFMQGAATMLYTPRRRRQSIQECGMEGGSWWCVFRLANGIYISCESPHGIFLVCVLYSGTNHMGGPFLLPLSKTGAYIYRHIKAKNVSIKRL